MDPNLRDNLIATATGLAARGGYAHALAVLDLLGPAGPAGHHLRATVHAPCGRFAEAVRLSGLVPPGDPDHAAAAAGMRLAARDREGKSPRRVIRPLRALPGAALGW
ncbi:MAG TPA: hypothetical protein VH092_00675 [Urbifossiella sp.]|jgi:hypothetical protein|nr:hypothetical protein [Urbifossiella sp.]